MYCCYSTRSMYETVSQIDLLPVSRPTDRQQVSRVEESLAEAWQLYRSDPTRSRRQLHHPLPPSPSQPLPPTPTTKTRPQPRETPPHPAASGLQQRLLNHGGVGEVDGDGGSVGLPRPPAARTCASALSPSPRTGLGNGGQQTGVLGTGGSSEGSQVEAMASAVPQATRTAAAAAAAAVSGGGGDGGGLATTTTGVGPAEYLQWLGDLSSMLVHEQWRKEV